MRRPARASGPGRRGDRNSDNAAATALWKTIGGAAGLAAADQAPGLRHTVPGPGGY
jgi:hypothetical protein